MAALDSQTTLSQNLSQFAARKLNRSRAAREELFPSARDWCETKVRMRGNGGPGRQAAVVPNDACTCRGHEEVAAVRCRLRRRFGPRDTRVRHPLLQQLERQ